MKTFLFRLAIFILAILIIQAFISIFFVPPPETITRLDTYLQKKTQVLYFGDSVIQFADANDGDRSSIVEMLAKINPNYTVGDLSSSAYDAGVYEAMMEYISHSRSLPQAIILPIGLRSFSPEWDQRPFYQFEKEKFFLTARPFFITYFYKILATLHVINLNPITEEEFLKTPVYYKQTQIGTVAYFEDPDRFANITPENIASKYMYSYLYALTDEHRKIADINKILDIAQKEGITVYAYINPIDYQAGSHYVGPDFVKQTSANANLICSLFTERGIQCLNLVFALPSEYFSHPAYPSEHLKEAGRRFIANKVNDAFLKKQP